MPSVVILAAGVGVVVAPWHGHHAHILLPLEMTLPYLFTVMVGSDCWECFVLSVSQRGKGVMQNSCVPGHKCSPLSEMISPHCHTLK